jgi:hypothetical protein
VARRAVNLHGCALASRAPFPQIPAFKSGCAASEGRASFVARRAVNLHGCALPHSAPRSSYCGGTPAARSSYRGALPPAAAPPYLLGARPLRERSPGGRPHCALRYSYGEGTPGSAVRTGVGCPPFFLRRGYPGSAKLVLGRPPSCGDSAGPFRTVFTIRFRTDDPRPVAARPAGGRRPPG